MLTKKAYTLVEIIFVLIVIGILASISSPLFLQLRTKALASEAVSAMALIRQAQRDYSIVNNTYYDVYAGNILNPLPTSVAAGVPTPNNAGVDVILGVVQHFSNAAFSVDATSPVSARFTNPPVVDFLISVDGASSVACTATIVTDCAIKPSGISTFDLEMDNSGRVFVSYDNGTNWRTY